VRTPSPSRRAAGLVAVGAIAVTSGVLAVAAPAQAEPSGWAVTSDGGPTVTIPAGICAVDWWISGGRGGQDSTDALGLAGGLLRVTTSVVAGQVYTLAPGTAGGRAGAESSAAGTNSYGGNGVPGNMSGQGGGGGGAASAVLLGGNIILTAPGGRGAGSDGGDGGVLAPTGTPARLPNPARDYSGPNDVVGRDAGYITAAGVDCESTVAPPAAPTIQHAAPGPGQLTVWFTPAAGTITDHAPGRSGWEYSLDGGAWQAADTRTVYGQAAQQQFTVFGVTNGHTYEVRVRATSSAGAGAAAGPVRVTPFQRSGPPAAVSVRTVPAGLALSWSPPTNPGTFPIAGYSVSVIGADATEEDPGEEYGCQADAAARGCVIEVPSGADYIGYVSAVDDHGFTGDYAVVSTKRMPLPEIPPTVPDKDGDLLGTAGPITTVTAGKTVVLKGSGYAPGSTVRALVYSTPRELTTVVADANGAFEVTVTIPGDLPAGQHSLVVTGFDADGAVRNLRVDVTVSGSGAAPVVNHVQLASTDDTASAAAKSGARPGGLADTGASIALPLIGGLAAVGIGGGLIVATRRRKNA
jgi:hypothetical protein